MHSYFDFLQCFKSGIVIPGPDSEIYLFSEMKMLCFETMNDSVEDGCLKLRYFICLSTSP